MSNSFSLAHRKRYKNGLASHISILARNLSLSSFVIVWNMLSNTRQEQDEKGRDWLGNQRPSPTLVSSEGMAQIANQGVGALHDVCQGVDKDEKNSE